MAFVDGQLFYVILMSGIGLIVPESSHGRVHGCLNLVVSVLIILGGILMILMAFGYLLLMVSLLIAVPFGTIVYMGAFGTFPTGSAAASLSAGMTLKIGFVVLLVLAHQSFLRGKTLVLLILTSLLCSVLISFLYGFVPGFLVSVADALAALVCGVLGVVWALVFLVASIPAVVRAVG